MSENNLQNIARIIASQRGGFLWRNNSGAFQDAKGRWVRYGLGNDSKAINKVMKSSDLIGVMPVTITQDMVGKKIGQFVAIEIKDGEWRFTKGDERAEAQLNFLHLIDKVGGAAGFATCEADLYRILPHVQSTL